MTLQTAVTAGSDRDIASNLRIEGRRFGFSLGTIVTALIERDARYRALCRLQTLDEHLLRDMGLTRDAVRGGRLR
jgi:uncharacterized protein YjiS (DUF1127 family)